MPDTNYLSSLCSPPDPSISWPSADANGGTLNEHYQELKPDVVQPIRLPI